MAIIAILAGIYCLWKGLVGWALFWAFVFIMCGGMDE